MSLTAIAAWIALAAVVGGSSTPAFASSAAWREFKEHYAALGAAATAEAVLARSTLITAWEPRLLAALPRQGAAAEALRQLLDTRVQEQLRLLQVPRGEAPAPDRDRILTNLTASIAVDTRALAVLRELGVSSEGWVRDHLAADLSGQLEALADMLPPPDARPPTALESKAVKAAVAARKELALVPANP